MKEPWSLSLERELIKKSKRNSKYFEAIYDQYFNRIYRFAYKKVANEVLAEEFTSETFYKALLKIRSYDEDRLTFSSWLYKIALNEIRMYFRKNQSAQYVISIDDLLRELIDEPGGVTPSDKSHLEHTLSNLPEKDLSILELRFYDNMPFKDIAELCDLSEGAVKMRVKRTIHKLREDYVKE